MSISFMTRPEMVLYIPSTHNLVLVSFEAEGSPSIVPLASMYREM
jgi:hypothetical protein